MIHWALILGAWLVVLMHYALWGGSGISVGYAVVVSATALFYKFIGEVK